jgi:(hydroxyamino)benzene mutase
MATVTQDRQGARLLQLGILLFLLGLLTGFVSPSLANPRLGLSSHLEGLLNGMFLAILGLVWPRLALPSWALRAGFWLVVYGTFANWLTTLLGAAWGAGGGMMPIAAGGFEGTRPQELVVTFGLLSLSIAMVVGCGLVLWGLSRRAPMRS